MSGERTRFGRDAFLHVTIAREANNMLVENLVLIGVEPGGRHFRGYCDSNGISNALTKRASGALHAGRVAEFRMSRCFAVQLAEPFDVRHWQIVSAQVQPRIEKHAAVSGGEHEIVPADPAWLVGIMLESVPIKHRAHFGTAKRQSQMSGFRRLYRVHAQTAGLVCRPREDFDI